MKAVEILDKIQNVLKVDDSEKVVSSIEDLLTQLAEAPQVTNVVGDLITVPDEKTEARFANIEKKQEALEKENTALRAQRDHAVEQMGGVLIYQNSEILEKRRVEIQAFFDAPVCKINPAQLKDALEMFVDIEPEQVEDTQALYDHSVKVWNLNQSNADQLTKLQGANPDGDEPVVGGNGAEALADKIEVAVQEYKKANNSTHEAAVKAVEISHKDLHAAYEKAMAK